MPVRRLHWNYLECAATFRVVAAANGCFQRFVHGVLEDHAVLFVMEAVAFIVLPHVSRFHLTCFQRSATFLFNMHGPSARN